MSVAYDLPDLKEEIRPLWGLLNHEHDKSLFAIADGAANPFIAAHLVSYQVPNLALYQNADLSDDKYPRLFPLDKDRIFSKWYLQASIEQHWGIIIGSSRSLVELAEHFKKFMIVQDETAALHFMRFFDPRVCNAFLQVLTNEQRREFFSPDLIVWMPKPGFVKVIVKYSVDDGRLCVVEQNLDDFGGELVVKSSDQPVVTN